MKVKRNEKQVCGIFRLLRRVLLVGGKCNFSTRMPMNIKDMTLILQAQVYLRRLFYLRALSEL